MRKIKRIRDITFRRSFYANSLYITNRLRQLVSLAFSDYQT